jgi:hypothetical protein
VLRYSSSGEASGFNDRASCYSRTPASRLIVGGPLARTTSANRLKSIRLVHHDAGVVFAPTILFSPSPSVFRCLACTRRAGEALTFLPRCSFTCHSCTRRGSYIFHRENRLYQGLQRRTVRKPMLRSLILKSRPGRPIVAPTHPQDVVFCCNGSSPRGVNLHRLFMSW